MATKLILCILLTHNMLLYCASAAVHSHGMDNVERESDGSFRARDYDHYGDSGHNTEFDHEAILGSVREAEEFDKLSPDEAKVRLSQLIPKMDINSDNFVDRSELKKWILKSFLNLAREEAQERLSEADNDHDGAVSWAEYLNLFGVEAEDEIAADDTGDTGMTLKEERGMWVVADANSDGLLELDEFQMFTNPEEYQEMHPFLINQTLNEKDTNRDGFISFHEYIGDRGAQQDKDWLLVEKEKFDGELDMNKDGMIDLKEIRTWIIPDNDEIATEEVDHLFAAADDNHDDLLSYDEILEHHEVFVGSDANDSAGDFYGEHFDDEL